MAGSGIAIDAAARRQIEELNARYIRAIDDDQLEAWPDLFTEKCLYRIITRENVDRGFTTPLMECASRGMLIDRVTGYRRVNIYEPQRYTHALSGLVLKAVDATRIACTQSYVVVRTMVTGEMSIFSAGVYRDRVVLSENGAKFEERIVVQESRRVDTLLVIPL
jgi:anthranilate 1,2-dioxygenase small subunit